MNNKLKKTITLLFFVAVGFPVYSQKSHLKEWAVTPPMGWNSYDAYFGCITEKQFKEEVDVIEKKLLPYGYNYVTVDYCWFNPGPKGWDADNWITFDVEQPYKSYGDHFSGMAMDGYGRLLPAVNRFPSAISDNGFKAIAEFVHAKKMKFGIHIMRGIAREAVQKNTPILASKYHAKDIADTNDICVWNQSMYGVDATKPGAQEYYNSLLQLYAKWGVDLIKVDDIGTPVYKVGEIELLRHAIDKCGRKILLSLSPGDAMIGFANHMNNNANMWRVSNDMWDNWKDIFHNFDLLNNWTPFIGNGTWPDADMLPIGRLCLTGYPEAHKNVNSSKREHFSFLTYDEQKTMMSLWSFARSPLIWGGSALYSNDSTFSLLTNETLLAIDKSSINNHQLYMPPPRGDFKDYRIWTAESLDKKKKYVALFNLKDVSTDITFKQSWDFWKGEFNAMDIWAKQPYQIKNGEIKALQVPAHGVAVFELQKK